MYGKITDPFMVLEKFSTGDINVYKCKSAMEAESTYQHLIEDTHYHDHSVVCIQMCYLVAERNITHEKEHT